MAATPTVDAVFHAIADRHRRAILDLLVVREMPVQDLVARFDVSFPAISQHLRILRDAGLVARRAVGRRRYYRATPNALRDVHDWTAHFSAFWDDRLDRLGHYLEEGR